MNNYSRSIQIAKPAVTSKKGMVVCNHKVAAEAGAEVLAAGGSAMDAAITTSFMLGVCEPWMSGLGGCGQMLVYSAATGAVDSIDFGTTTPRSLDPAAFPLAPGSGGNLFGWPKVVDDRNLIGAPSVCVPTLVRAMDVAHKRYGRMPWRELLAAAAQQAEQGLVIDAYASLFIGSSARDLQTNEVAAQLFLDEDGLPPTIAWSSGNTLQRPMPALAATLGAIADDGADVFYEGEVGKCLIDDIQALGGYLSRHDLIAYRPKILPARQQISAGHRVHVAPELNAGPSLLPVLSDMDRAYAKSTPGSDDYLDLINALHNSADHRMATMGGDGDAKGAACTTHFNVVDRQGNMVVVTQTLLSAFGSKVVSGQTGVLLNNGVMWFDPQPGRPNSIAASKRPLNNMCPVIAISHGDKKHRSVVGIGASGGRKIMPAVAQILWRMFWFDQSLEQAFHAPRLETSVRNKITADHRLGDSVLDAIRQQFDLDVTERHFYPYAFACPSAIKSQGGSNAGCSEVYSLWGDAVSEEHVTVPAP